MRCSKKFYYAVDLDKDNIIALKHLAAVYFLIRQYSDAHAALGMHDAAIRDFTSTIYLAVKHLPDYEGRGISFTAKGNYKWAISDFDKSISISPNNPFIYRIRSEALANRLYSNALADLNKACSLEYRTVCDAVRQSKSDIANTETTFILQCSRRGSEEELYTASRSKLDTFFSVRMLSGMDVYFIDDLNP